MRRLIYCTLTLALSLSTVASNAWAQGSSKPELRKLNVPAAQSRGLATRLSLMYRDIDGVKISSDLKNGQLLVMAPEAAQQRIAKDVVSLLQSGEIQQASAIGPVQIQLRSISWREFEDGLKKLAGTPLPITTSQNGERASFQLNAIPLTGTTIEVDRRNNLVTVTAPNSTQDGWRQIIGTLDEPPTKLTEVTELLRLENAEPAPVQRAIQVLGQLDARKLLPVDANQGFRNALFQQDAGAAPSVEGGDSSAAANNEGGGFEDGTGADPAEGGSGVIGDTQIQFVPELGTIIIKGAKRDVQRVMDVIREIEKQSEVTQPDIEVIEMKYADSNAVAELLTQLYDDVLSARQGAVSITALDTPNALLLIGRSEAINSVRDLIAKVDIPIDESSRLRIFRLQYTSAADAEESIREFFTALPGSDDDPRPALGPRVRITADYRTNSLIISAAPRDMAEVTRLINELDVQQHSAKSEIKIFPLSNAIAEDLAPVIQEAISGESEVDGDGNMTTPSTTISIVPLGDNGNQILDSGILAGAVVTADTNANSIVVRAPAASMPLISELIRQLDIAPGIASLVKVFTIENGDATQLTAALQDLFGDDAATGGTSVGAGNLTGLPSSTASGDSSLVPLRFSTDQRTNSIIASGSADDLEVAESILLRLDTTGFSERITEVIWMRHSDAANIATAVSDYVTQRSTRLNSITQFQQGGLGPFDLPDRDLIAIAEPISNSLLLSVSPRLYEDVRRLIDKLDRRRPMVLMKVLLAEVRLGDEFEIGGEVGLQDSLMFDRGIATGSIATNNPQSVPGFTYNGNGTPNVNSFGQESLAGRGLSSFGVGSTNSSLGYGGFVLSAASESVSLLLRTLQDAQRLQILSRPQIMTMDNTEGFVQVGRQIARVTGVINNGVAGTQVVTEDIEVGLIMEVRPRVGADGLIIMDINATRSARDDNNGTVVPTGDGGTVTIDDILRTTAQSTVAAYSGQTVIFGGLIQKTRVATSRRVPYLADIPVLGYFFKYDREGEERTEMLVILTPMVINGEEDLDYVKASESSRMSWCLADIVEMHGDVGLSGGYGLWGPAVGGTIYPDMQPTIDDFQKHSDSGDRRYYPDTDAADVFCPDADSVMISDDAHSEGLIQTAPAMINQGASSLSEGAIYGSTLLPEQQSTQMVPLEATSSPNAMYLDTGAGVNGATDGRVTPSMSEPISNPYSESIPQDALSIPRSTQPLSPGFQEGASRAPVTPSTNVSRQVSWQNANSVSQPAASFPTRLGASGQKPTTQSQNSTTQPIPSIFPQAWIR
ncbi:secretin N-terminal domain-containing protein [Novipirellula artificiosorum]|uniref:Type II secretion system protein D n=1 Tax=Novipirellula artificiosorum TaxID=2528016 RepID=A0A5C6E1C7_9BACT|nr:secretin N-terminal domain-containing protein [Novipirellula artificiosorum]TWU42525.1 Type II secretion system protein D precursor [Novipirellula artificiosorum]